jgi:amino acid adenylation domain-containing protein
LATGGVKSDLLAGAVSISGLFEATASRFPGNVALVHGNTVVSYTELNAHANTLAGEILKTGCSSNKMVALYAERSCEAIAAILAILKAGCAYVPLDPSYPSERLRWILEDTGASMTLMQPGLPYKLGDFGGVKISIETTLARACPGDHGKPDHAPGPNDLAYVMYTSGSMGVPKGVCVEHRNVLRLVCGQEYVPFGPDEVILQFAPLAFDASTFEIWGALLHGGTLVIAPPGLMSFQELERLVNETNVTTMWLTAGLFHQMVDEAPRALSDLRQMLAGGDALSPDHCRRFLEANPGVTLINGYGPTECTTFATTCRFRSPGDIGDSVPIGRPLLGTQCHILDPGLRPVPGGEAGELFIGGDGVARGYLNRPDITAERFFPDPFSAEPGARMYRTGDRVRLLDDGRIAFLGRLDNQVKIRGFRIEPGEIEATLRNYPGVRDAVVVAHRLPGSETDKHLVAYLLADACVSGTEPIRKWLSDHLPAHMIPSFFVKLDAFPLTPNGKVDRDRLPDPQETAGASWSADPPASYTEEILLGIWGQILHVNHAGVETNFLDLGGHSLAAMRIVARVRDAFAVEIPVSVVFEYPTVRAMATRLDMLAKEKTTPGLPPIRPVLGTNVYPMSYQQEQLWFIQKAYPESKSYNCASALSICGPELDADALAAAMDDLFRRHPVLRTTFRDAGGELAQVVSDEVHLVVTPVALISSECNMRREEALRSISALAEEPFDLRTGPLTRAYLYEISEAEHILGLHMHHIITDGWSQNLITRDLAALYDARKCRLSSTLPELPLQYGDYVLWKRACERSDAWSSDLKYWEKRLLDACPKLDFPEDYARPSRQTFKGRTIINDTPPSLTSAIRDLAISTGVTVTAAAMAFWRILFARHCNQDDFLLGAAFAGRTRSEIENSAGYFTVGMPIRADLSQSVTLLDALHLENEAILGASNHQEIPFQKIIESITFERDPSRSPVFQVMFAGQDVMDDPILGGELAFASEDVYNASSKFDFTISFMYRKDSIRQAFEFNTDIYSEETARRILKRWETLAYEAVKHPQSDWRELRLLPEEEEHLVTIKWNETCRKHDHSGNIGLLYEAQATKTPDAIALIDGSLQMTYAELSQHSDKIAAALRANGVGLGGMVGILHDRTMEMTVTVLGILKAGCAYLPIAADYPMAWIETVLQDAMVPMLISRSDPGFNVSAKLVLLDDLLQDCVKMEEPVQAAMPDLDDPAYVIYTSGSTGKPKGVVMPNRGLLNLLQWQARRSLAGEATRTLQFAPLSFDVSFQEMFSTWSTGGTLVLVGQDTRMDMRALLMHIIDNGIERLFVPVLVLHHLAMEACESDIYPLCLKEVITAGEQLSVTNPVRAFFSALPDCRLINQYGPSETHVVSEYVLEGDPQDWASLPPIGRPIDNASLYILDARGNPAPIGVPGELYIGGDGVARGYLNRPELTAERFLPDPFSGEPGARMYRTGDRARFLHDGNIEFMGRLDDQVKIRGFRVEPGEVEAALETHPGVREAVVAARDGLTAVAGKALVAYVIPAGEPVQTDELRALLSARLPAHMMPSFFVSLDAFPLTPSGKVDRRSLPAPVIAESVPDDMEPATPLEAQLAEIWRDLLGLDQVGRASRFFDLGGHSLLAVRMMARVRDALGVDVPLRLFFENPTIAGLANVIEKIPGQKSMTTPSVAFLSQGPGCNLVTLRGVGPGPALFLVEGAGSCVETFGDLARHLDGDTRVIGLDMGSEEIYPDTAEEMAALYISRMRHEQPEGPYHIAGWSYGGMLAYEMARQLAQDGAEVGLVGLLDSYAPLSADSFRERLSLAAAIKTHTIRRRADIFLTVLPLLPGYLRDGWQLWREGRQDANGTGIPLNECLSYIRHDINRQYSLARSGLGHAARGENRMELLRDPFVRSVSRRITESKRAMGKYGYHPYPGRVTLFRTEFDPHGYAEVDPKCGWGNYAEGGVDVHTVPGNHFVLLREPFVRTLAERMCEALEAAQSRKA